MITAIEIENFKAIRDRIRVEIRPITLLFGPNSAGKSTILQALRFVSDILMSGECNGPTQRLGGFESLVHGHDKGRSISLRVDLHSLGASLPRVVPDDSPHPRFMWDEVLPDWTIRGGIPFWVEVTVTWDIESQLPHVTRYEVGLVGERFATITASPHGDMPVRVDINFDHEWASSANPDSLGRGNGLPYLADALNHSAVRKVVTLTGNDRFRFCDTALPLMEKELGLYRLREYTEAELKEVRDRRRARGGTDDDDSVFIGETAYHTESVDDDQNAALNTLIVGPLGLLRFALNPLHLGPLRDNPSTGYSPKRPTPTSSWINGIAAWDTLHGGSRALIDETNKWLLQLGTKSQIRRKDVLELDLESEIGKRVRACNPDTIRALSETLPERRYLFVIDERHGIELAPAALGTGISQIIPVVVAALQRTSALVMIEQPELHMHPAVQVELGDLFIAMVTREGRPRKVLVETHSEHLILRLLRRIRETTDNEREADVPTYTGENLSVLYVESTSDGVCVRRLRVDERGEFVDRWPKGFFEERAGELF